MTASAFGTVGLGATLAGGLLSAYGATKEGEATQQMYNYRAQVAKINADIERQNATWALNKGDVEAKQYGMKAGQQFAAIRTAQAASGIDISSGSTADVQRSQREIATTDIMQIHSNAAKVAYDYETKATMDENQARLDTMTGEYAKKAGGIKAASSILGSISSVSSKWQQGKSTGLWD